MIIYLLTNRMNGRYYVGQTIQPLRDRLKQHELDAKRKRGPLQDAIRMHGIGAFDVEVLSETSSIDELNYLETLWILISAATDRAVGYNCTSGGLNHIRTLDARHKMRLAKLGAKQSPELIAKRTAGQRGRKLTKEHVERIQAGRRLCAEETKAKLSAIKKGRPRPDLRGKIPWNKGRRYTQHRTQQGGK